MVTIKPWKERLAEMPDTGGWIASATSRIDCMQTEIDELRQENARLRADILPLQIFTDSLTGEFPEHGELDGFDLQNIAESAGLLVPETRTVPCSEGCNCTDYAKEGETIECYRVQDVLKRARIAAAQHAARAALGG